MQVLLNRGDQRESIFKEGEHGHPGPLQARLQARFPVRFRRHQAHCGSASSARSARLHASSLPAVRPWTMDFWSFVLGPLVFWSLGLLVPWSFGPLVLWSLGPLVPWSRRPLPGTLESTLSCTLSQAPIPLWLSFLGTLGTLARLNYPPSGERSFVCERGSAICHSAGHPLPAAPMGAWG